MKLFQSLAAAGIVCATLLFTGTAHAYPYHRLHHRTIVYETTEPDVVVEHPFWRHHRRFYTSTYVITHRRFHPYYRFHHFHHDLD